MASKKSGGEIAVFIVDGQTGIFDRLFNRKRFLLPIEGSIAAGEDQFAAASRIATEATSLSPKEILALREIKTEHHAKYVYAIVKHRPLNELQNSEDDRYEATSRAGILELKDQYHGFIENMLAIFRAEQHIFWGGFFSLYGPINLVLGIIRGDDLVTELMVVVTAALIGLPLWISGTKKKKSLEPLIVRAEGPRKRRFPLQLAK